MRYTRTIYAGVLLTMFVMLSPYVVDTVLGITEDEIYDTQYEMDWVQIPYGNGIDDDADGTIDETDGSEPDVITGSLNATTANNTIADSWYDDYKMDGVMVGGAYEELWSIESSENISISPVQDCYEADVSGADAGTYDVIHDVICVVSFYVNIPPSKLMNGASEFWYRSPLNWDEGIYKSYGGGTEPQWYLNIYNEDNELVYASNQPDNTIPSNRKTVDDSGYTRIYEKVNMNFRTNERYRFEEYVETDADAPINDVELFFGRFQDIAGDEEVNTYVFYGTSYARKVTTECSWSAIFTIGKGLQGGEKIIFGSMDPGNFTITTQWINGSSSIDDSDGARVIFPLRTTRPLNITVKYRVNSGGLLGGWQTTTEPIVNLTGTLIYDFNVTDTNASAPNLYQFQFIITNLDENYSSDGVDNDGDTLIDEADEQAMTFYIYPVTGNFIYIENTTGIIEANHFVTHVELAMESEDPVGAEAGTGPDLLTMLIGFLIIVIGVILIISVIGASIGVPLLFSGVAIGTASTIMSAVGIGAIALGSALVIAGAGGVSLNQIWNGLADGTIRIINGIISGIEYIAGAIWNGILFTVTKIIELGQAIGYWAGVILDALAQIVYFLAFIIIIYMWNWFLVLMKHIARGDIEQAFAKIKKPIVKYGKKTLRYSRGYTATEGFLRNRAKKPYGWQAKQMREYPNYKKRID
jgi:hypothetical protein